MGLLFQRFSPIILRFIVTIPNFYPLKCLEETYELALDKWVGPWFLIHDRCSHIPSRILGCTCFRLDWISQSDDPQWEDTHVEKQKKPTL